MDCNGVQWSAMDGEEEEQRGWTLVWTVSVRHSDSFPLSLSLSLSRSLSRSPSFLSLSLSDPACLHSEYEIPPQLMPKLPVSSPAMALIFVCVLSLFLFFCSFLSLCISCRPSSLRGVSILSLCRSQFLCCCRFSSLSEEVRPSLSLSNGALKDEVVAVVDGPAVCTVEFGAV